MAGQGQRGRPAGSREWARDLVLQRIRTLAARRTGLFRVHLEQPGLYARARRRFGSWAAAVLAAGFDYSQVVQSGRARALDARRLRAQRRRTVRATGPGETDTPPAG